jgi:putative hydrolase of the HAD superfamily
VNQEYIRIIRERSVPLAPVPTGAAARGQLCGPVRAVLFDVYGTLFVSGSGDLSTAGGSPAESANGRTPAADLLARYGIDREPEQVEHAFVKRIQQEHTRLKQQGIDHPEVRYEQVWAEVLGLHGEDAFRFALEHELLRNPVWPMPGGAELIEQLAGSGLVLGIVSNAQSFTPLLFPALLGGEPAELEFARELVFYSYRSGRAKPSESFFREAATALNRMGILQSQTVYVGNDMRNDVYAAGRAGFQTVLFAGDRRSLRLREEDQRCRELEPDLTITGLMDLADHVRRANSQHGGNHG